MDRGGWWATVHVVAKSQTRLSNEAHCTCYFRLSSVSQFSRSVVSRLTLCDPMDCSTQASPSFTISQSLLKLMSIESMMTTISFSVTPFSSCSQSFPASVSFPMSRLSESCGQSIGALASASVLPINTQDWFPLRLTGLNSFSPRNSQESSPALQIKGNNSLALNLFYGPTLTSYIITGKIIVWHSVCHQGDVPAFWYTVFLSLLFLQGASIF